MRKLYSFIIIAVLSTISLRATHIVGGEFQFVELRAGEYDIFLNLYFDAINGNPNAEDQSFTATIFRKSDGATMDLVTFNNINSTSVEYENPDCKIPEIETRRITYAAQNTNTGNSGFQFTVAEYNDPQGYYIVWDRCCRNDQIVNIQDPGDEGMLFYLHFPAIFDSSDELIGWSSPAFPSIPATYACVGENFTLDFGATDIDGDSLVFSMNTPLAGYSDDQNPLITAVLPEPYPQVFWSPGIGINNQIPGTPDLSINQNTGLLKMTPNQPGLHVFSVQCDEYRNGIKIGEVKRDFQIFVYDNCQQNSPPKIDLALGDSAYYQTGDTLKISTAQLSCIDLLVTDDLDLRNNEKISINIVPVNFTTEAEMISKGDDEFVGGPGDTLSGWQICPPSCEDITDEPFVFDVIVSDDGCPQAKKDTSRVIIELILEENTPPVLTNDYNDTNYIEIDVFEIDTIDIEFFGFDIDSVNLLNLSVIPYRFSLDDFGMEFKNKEEITPSLNSSFQWIINCDKLENSKKEEFILYFVLRDNTCNESSSDTTTMVINLNREVNNEDFEIFNIFSPNGDGINDYFIVNGLPRDNCENAYIGFEIYNRWGKKVYRNDSRTIKWDGDNLSDGTYFYLAEYTNRSYKGHVTIRR